MSPMAESSLGTASTLAGAGSLFQLVRGSDGEEEAVTADTAAVAEERAARLESILGPGAGGNEEARIQRRTDRLSMLLPNGWRDIRAWILNTQGKNGQR